ncbi:Retrovirus-related Pol polyprotein from transposon RE1 [Vitis vinifera]|uniref:Retrovirus-related Pol polyprotein from transposon RE1 n=1 Tax=Vitis vinifera TaxID=29760 RepID=A0A438C3N8_VITVI|nr:Retrovirus-related Pol polyprotein from transposon RE1 [Vitis vinifera]
MTYSRRKHNSKESNPDPLPGHESELREEPNSSECPGNNQTDSCQPVQFISNSNSESFDDLNIPIATRSFTGSRVEEGYFEEMRALEKNHTWEVMGLPKGKTTVGCKWVFTVKYNSNGSLERYKARLVAKGFTQTYGIDYLETFAPVAKLNTVRVLLSIAANLDWPLQQLDVKNAFLNGNLEEEVYMDPPPGFDEHFGSKVCKLKKSLYGLKQSPRAWLNDSLNSDHVTEMDRLKKSLALEFEIKDLGSLRYFLGMEVARSKRKLGDTNDGNLVNTTRIVSQFMHSPYEVHLEAVYRILRYLKSTPGKGLFFKKSEQKTIEAYTDADWAGSVTDRRSTSGYCTYIWGNLVTWRSKKQRLVARSSAEAEYRAMAHGETKREVCDRRFVGSLRATRNKAWASLYACEASKGVLIIWNSKKLSNEEWIGEGKGVGIQVTHLLFADDTLVFCDDSQEQLAFLSWLLMWFEATSGLRINLNKSEILPVGNVENAELWQLSLAARWDLSLPPIWGSLWSFA